MRPRRPTRPTRPEAPGPEAGTSHPSAVVSREIPLAPAVIFLVPRRDVRAPPSDDTPHVDGQLG